MEFRNCLEGPAITTIALPGDQAIQLADLLAVVLREVPERPGPDPAVRNQCRWWSTYLAHLLSDASASTAAAINQHPLSPTEPAPVALRLAS